MTKLTSFQRKVLYLSVIVVLFAAMWVVQSNLIDPARTKYELAEETLGEVDETGFAINLVLAGFRGIAANLLWGEVREMQRVHDWEGMKTLTNSIAMLQPHFVTVWIYQAWNLAWNISVEWDDPKDKYWWILEGFKFLRRGQAQNESDPDITWQMGWIFHSKIGKSDEADLFRKYWKEDKTNNKFGYDNFKVAYDYFWQAAELVRGKQRNPKTMGTTPFLSYPAHAKVEYAEHLMRDGRFKEHAREAWREALREFEELRAPLDLGKPGERKYVQIQRVKIINYDAWIHKCQAEIDLVDAREHFYLGRQADLQADFPRALDHYRKGVAQWNSLQAKHKLFFEDEANGEYAAAMKARIKELEEQIK